MSEDLKSLINDSSSLSSSAFVSRDWGDVNWLSSVMKCTVHSVRVEDLSNAGGFVNDMKRLRLVLDDNQPLSLILKSQQSSQPALGLAREAFFFSEFAAKLSTHCNLPKVYFAEGCMTTGSKHILMEDLSTSVQSGYFFGPNPPPNFGKSAEVLAKLTEAWKGFTSEDVALAAFENIAAIHAKFWKDETLFHMTWLKGTDWWQGEGKAKWVSSQQLAATNWTNYKTKIESGECKVKWAPALIDLVDASMAKADFDTFQASLKSKPWSLIHNDFHPGNMMVRPLPITPTLDLKENSESSLGSSQPTSLASRTPDIALLDFEAIGLGIGVQDLGQYLISHMAPTQRRQCETRLLRAYHNKLLEYGVPEADFPWEVCLERYRFEGLQRWIFFLPLLSHLPDVMVQYFHDQCAAFMLDHDVNPDNIGMPRV